VEESELPVRRQPAANDLELARLIPERAHVDREDLVEPLAAEVGLVHGGHDQLRLARRDVLAVPLPSGVDHLGRPVDRGDLPVDEPLADQGDGHPVAAADLEHPIGRTDGQRLDRPDQALCSPRGHAAIIRPWRSATTRSSSSRPGTRS
jgi:hypothetical protein